MDQKKYDELCKLTDTKSIDTWYSKTEKVFKGHEINCEDDFIKVVAFAYSWMPTIPEWRQELNWEECKTKLDSLKNGEPEALKKLIQLIAPSINNSIVGASKVAHFICPNHAPIIDSNVVNGWRTLFFPKGLRRNYNDDIAALPSNFGAYGQNVEERKRHIDLYIKYSENLAAWANTLTNVSARDIETRLYLLGKQISKIKLTRVGRKSDSAFRRM